MAKKTGRRRNKVVTVKAPRNQLLGVCLGDSHKSWAGYRYVRVVRVKIDIEACEVIEVLVRTYGGDDPAINGFNGPLRRLNNRREFFDDKSRDRPEATPIGIVKGGKACVSIDDYYTRVLIKKGVIDVAKKPKAKPVARKPKPKTKALQAQADTEIAAEAQAQEESPPTVQWHLVNIKGERVGNKQFTNFNEASDAVEASPNLYARSDDCEHAVTEDHMICQECGRCRESLDSNDICTECGGVDENAEAQEAADKEVAIAGMTHAHENDTPFSEVTDEFEEDPPPAAILEPADMFEAIPPLNMVIPINGVTVAERTTLQLGYLLKAKPSLLKSASSLPRDPSWEIQCPGSDFLLFAGFGVRKGKELCTAIELRLVGYREKAKRDGKGEQYDLADMPTAKANAVIDAIKALLEANKLKGTEKPPVKREKTEAPPDEELPQENEETQEESVPDIEHPIVDDEYFNI